ncbi:hypothetical protein GY45DRAFT_1331976 [Cubamyces sp. BRFM 1775]|nr:hypothetical protein GY45DRAFT_1331976 [Cubamyces sp. BRFM 1775]
MNTTAESRTAAAQSVSQVLLVAVGALEEGTLAGCCPVGRMFDLLRAGVRLVLIGAASLVLALVGIILSIVAAVRRAYYRWRAIENTSPVDTDREHPSSPLLGHQREDHAHVRHRPHSARRPTTSPRSATAENAVADEKTLRNLPLRSSPEPILPVAEPSPTAPSPSSPRHRKPQRQRTKPQPKISEIGLPSIDTAMESVEQTRSSTSPVRPPLDVFGGASGEDAVRALSSPAQVLSDTSTQSHSTTEPSEESAHADGLSARARAERSPSPSRRVLQRLREHHSQFRERCLSRVHSMPNAKVAKVARRTDPYQAPYYFPTPLSPDADTYVEQVRRERKGARVRTTTDPISFRQYWEPVPLPSPRTSPRGKTQPLPPVESEIEQQEMTGEPPAATSPNENKPPVVVEPEGESTPRQVNHRWSFHLPHLPRKMHSIDSSQQEARLTEKHSSRSLFGHQRRRHGTASEDLQSKRTLKAPRPSS